MAENHGEESCTVSQNGTLSQGWDPRPAVRGLLQGAQVGSDARSQLRSQLGVSG